MLFSFLARSLTHSIRFLSAAIIRVVEPHLFCMPPSFATSSGLLSFQRCILVIRCLSKLSIESSHPATPLFLFIRFFGCRPALTGEEKITSAPDALRYPLLRAVGCKHSPLFKSLACGCCLALSKYTLSQGAASGAQTGS